MFRRLAAGLATAAMMVVVTPRAHAQGGGNTIFLELGGNGLLYSINYERSLPSKVALRAGFSYMSVSATSGTAGANASVVTVPLTLSYLAGSGSAKFELGGGATMTRFSGSASTGFGDEISAGSFVPVGTFIAGLRLAPAGGGFNFKLNFTPFWHPDIGFFPWGGLGFGIGF